MLGKITAVAAASLTIGTLALPGAAWANPSTASGSCQAGVGYEGHDYPQTDGNTATISIDDVVVRTVTFSTSTSGNVANPDKTKPHTWRVVWDRVNGTHGDRTQQGQFAACESTPTTTTTAATPTTSVATDVPPVPTSTTVLPAATTTTTGPEIACVLGPDGHYSFAGTNNPCEGPPPVPTPVAAFVCAGVMVADVCVVPTTTVAPPSHPSSLPSTGSKTDIELAIGLGALAIGYCLLLMRRGRA